MLETGFTEIKPSIIAYNPKYKYEKHLEKLSSKKITESRSHSKSNQKPNGLYEVKSVKNLLATIKKSSRTKKSRRVIYIDNG